MRQPPPGLDPADALSDWQQQAPVPAADWTTYNCKFVTPLYGGGVRAGAVDAAMPIRPSGIRGQLRFWWRLACGPFASPAEMFRRESAIWGGIGGSGPTASRVSVRVKARPVQSRDLTAKSQVSGFPSYALILDPGADPTLLKSGYQFEISVHCASELTADLREEVIAALRWWASFGGVGARTRRGLGAVQVQELTPVSAEEVEAKRGQLWLRDAEKGAEQAWHKAVGRLSGFRQGEGTGRNPRRPGTNTPRRSRWPEPDMIRRQTGRHAPEHRPEHPVRDLYPRAAFGLPIVFHFKDENKGEPAQQLLVPEGGDRMASQLVLRPYWDGQRWHPCALLIPGWEQALAVVAQCSEATDHRAWPRDADAQAQRAAQIKPMAKRGNDPLSAFMTYFQED